MGRRHTRAAWVLMCGLLAFAALASPSAAGAAEPYDDLLSETLGDTLYETADELDRTVQFNTEKFTVQGEEEFAAGSFLACRESGAKDGWVRFGTAVAGKLLLNVSKTTPGGNIMYGVYESATAHPSFDPDQLDQIGCLGGRNPETNAPRGTSAMIATPGLSVHAGKFVFVQVMMECNAGFPMPYCDTGEQSTTPGGPTTVRIRFIPDNVDGDSVPDTLDFPCLSEAGTIKGCPDADGDGVAEGKLAADHCPGQKGHPDDGCPDHDHDKYNWKGVGGKDCNDNNKRIHPKAHDVPGNGKDEDCKGGDAPYPRLDNEITVLKGIATELHRTAYFLSPFKVGGPLVKGMVVRMTCKGPGCSTPKQTVRVRSAKVPVEIGSRLKGHRLGPSAKVTIVVTRPGYIGVAMSYTVRRRGKMKEDALCVPVGSREPQEKCR